MSDILVSAGRVRFGAEWVSIDTRTEFKLEPSLWLRLKTAALAVLGLFFVFCVLRAFAAGPAEGVVTLVTVSLGFLGVFGQFDSLDQSCTLRADTGRREADILTTSDVEFGESVRAFLDWAKSGLQPGEEFQIDLAAKTITRTRKPEDAAS